MLIFYANCPLGMSGSTERTDAFPAGEPGKPTEQTRDAQAARHEDRVLERTGRPPAEAVAYGRELVMSWTITLRNE